MEKVEIDRLISVVRDLSSARSLDGMLAVISRAARDLTGSDGAVVALKEGEGVRGVAENGIAPLWRGRRTTLPDSASGWAVLHHQRVIIEDLVNDPRFPADPFRSTFARGLAVVPIGRDEPFGSLAICWMKSRKITPAEADILERLADAAGAAFENGRYLRELRDKLRASDARVDDLARRLDVQDHKADPAFHGQKLESLGRLAGGVAHDFNNLLTVIAGYSEMILSGSESPEMQSTALKEIYAAAQRGASLTRQLLSFGRKQIARPVVLDLNWVLERMEQMLSRLVGDDIRLSTSYGHDLGRVKADLGQIEHVILNLVVNARDAMPKGGEIALATRNAEVVTWNKSPMASGSYVVLAVADNGVGMNPETLDTIFEPQLTDDDAGQRLRLGLSTVHGIITQGGGHIRVVSAPDEGTTFAIYLPRVSAADEIPPPPPRRGNGELVKTGTILLVEDEMSIRALVGNSLRAHGFKVLEASDGIAALQASAAHPEPIDLLLTDSVLPHLSGPDLCARIMEGRPDLKVLFMSGYTDGEVFARSQKYGGDFLQKPFTLEDLHRKVNEALVTR